MNLVSYVQWTRTFGTHARDGADAGRGLLRRPPARFLLCDSGLTCLFVRRSGFLQLRFASFVRCFGLLISFSVLLNLILIYKLTDRFVTEKSVCTISETWKKFVFDTCFKFCFSL